MSQSVSHDAGAPLRVAGFRYFITARFSSMLAAQMKAVAIGWFVYDLTHQPLSLGLLGLSSFLPALVLSIWAGNAADRFNRKKILVFNFIAQGLCACFLWLLTAEHNLPVSSRLVGVYLIAALSGAVRAFGSPAGQALMPTLVRNDHFSAAVAWGSSVWQFAMIAGPALGGFVYGFGHGAHPVFAVCIGLFAISAFSISRINDKNVSGTYKEHRIDHEVIVGSKDHEVIVDSKNHEVIVDPRKKREELLAGFRFVWNQPVILSAISLDLFAVVLGGAVALLPIFARDILHTGPTGLGWLRSGPAFGAAAMALWLAYRPVTRRAGAKILTAVFVFGVGTVAFALSEAFWVSMVCLIIIGAADMISVAVRHTVVQIATPDRMRGRVSAVSQVFIMCSNELGEFESGVTAAWLGVVPATVLGGVGCCLVVLIWTFFFKSLRTVDKLSALSAAPT